METRLTTATKSIGNQPILNATVPAQYEELNATQFIRITVITVTGSLINVDCYTTLQQRN